MDCVCVVYRCVLVELQVDDIRLQVDCVCVVYRCVLAGLQVDDIRLQVDCVCAVYRLNNFESQQLEHISLTPC